MLVSCSLIQGPEELDGTVIQTPEEPALSVENDTERAQAVYVNERGERFDIVSPEEPDGIAVSCVEAASLVPVDSGSGEAPVKALVIGRRNDGRPGAWEILGDDSIHAVQMGAAGRRCSELPDSDELDWVLHSFFGWVYYAETIVEDGQGGWIILGSAENESGWGHGRWQIEPGTELVVYWRLAQSPNGRFYLVSRARVVGELKEEYAHAHGHQHDGVSDHPSRNQLRRLLRYLFGPFELFFLNRFEAYLVSYSEAAYDPDTDAVRVKGSDQNGDPVLAYIDAEGLITLEPDEGPGGGGETALVLETYPPLEGLDETDTTLELYSEDMTLLAADENSGVGLSARIALSPEPGAGIYYIKVFSSTKNFGSYALRAFLLEEGADSPAYVYPDIQDDSVNEPDSDAQGDPIADKVTPLPLGGVVSRALDWSGTDVDWVRLELP